MKIAELCSEYERLEMERTKLLRGENRNGVVDPVKFQRVADGLRSTQVAIEVEVRACMRLQDTSRSTTEALAYFAAWHALRLFKL